MNTNPSASVLQQPSPPPFPLPHQGIPSQNILPPPPPQMPENPIPKPVKPLPEGGVPPSTRLNNNMLPNPTPLQIFNEILPQAFRERKMELLTKARDILNADPTHKITISDPLSFDRFTIQMSQDVLNDDVLRTSIQEFYKKTFKKVEIKAEKINYQIPKAKENIIKLAQGVADNLASLDIRVDAGKIQPFNMNDIKEIVEKAKNLVSLKTSLVISRQIKQVFLREHPHLTDFETAARKSDIPSELKYPYAAESLQRYASIKHNQGVQYQALTPVKNSFPNPALSPYEIVYNPVGDGDCGVTAFSFTLIDTMINRKIPLDKLEERVINTREWLQDQSPDPNHELLKYAEAGFNLLERFIQETKEKRLTHEEFLKLLEGENGWFNQHALNAAIRLIAFSHSKNEDNKSIGIFTERLVAPKDFLTLEEVFGFKVPVYVTNGGDPFQGNRIGTVGYTYGIVCQNGHYLVIKKKNARDDLHSVDQNQHPMTPEMKIPLIIDYYTAHFDKGKDISDPENKVKVSSAELSESNRYLINLLSDFIRESNRNLLNISKLAEQNVKLNLRHPNKEVLDQGAKKLKELVANPEKLDEEITKEELAALILAFRVLYLRYTKDPVTWGEAKQILAYEGEISGDFKRRITKDFTK